jgi:hypothetical protein
VLAAALPAPLVPSAQSLRQPGLRAWRVPLGPPPAAPAPHPAPCPRPPARAQIQLEGLPTAPGWPAAAEVKALLTARIGRTFTTEELEEDVRMLLATGGGRGCGGAVVGAVAGLRRL